MKKAFSLLSFLLLVSLFFASCGGSEKKPDGGDQSDSEAGIDTEADTEPTDTGSDDSKCGNRIVDDGEVCDGGAKECKEIDPAFTDGFAYCKADCTGYDTAVCQKNPADPTDPTNPTDPTDPTDPTTPGPAGSTEFERITADSDPYNPAFVTVDDLDGDGHPDMIVAQYGPSSNLQMKGRYDIYWGTGDLSQWTREELNIGGDVKFPHPVKVADLNGDGNKDLVLPGGFLACSANPLAGGDCGVLFWLENKGGGRSNSWTRHDIVSMGYDHFFFNVELEDVDGDGILDILTNASKKTAGLLGGGEQDEILMWFKGTDTAERFDNTKRIISSGNGGPFPRFVDLNGDGRKDIALAQYFNADIAANGSFIWFEQGATVENWTKHVIDDESGESFMLEIIDDLYGDGVRRAVGVNHVNSSDTPNGPKEGVFVFDIPADPTQKWPKKDISDGIQSRKSPMTGPQGAPGLFGYGDITGNGLIDLVVSGDGDSRVFWFEQNPAGTFTQHTLDGVAGAAINSSGSFGQAGGMKIVDLDGDGRNEIIVTLYEDNKLYIYKVK